MDLVFYFSGTGNSYNVAKALSNNAINIASATNGGNYEADTIGFVFPVYCSLPPVIVTQFIKNSTFKSPYIWAVATYGGGAGGALSAAHKLLKTSGGLSYANGLILPDNSIIYGLEEKVKLKQLGEESGTVSRIKNDINNRVVKLPKNKPFADLVGKLSWFTIKNIYQAKTPRSNEKCTKCGICVRLCPTQNITMAEKGIIFSDKCEYCFGCIHFCPVNAIEFGKIKRHDNAAYHHPKVSADDLIKSKER
ncbi:MAG: EFR1 family ferrodoxin [Clostridia bacterium]